MTPESRQAVGNRAEQRALDYLQARGLRCIGRNYRTRRGEIDLIMEHGDELVFVEVRLRRHTSFGSAQESVTAAKQKRLTAAAASYLQRHDTDRGCRFDVVAIDGDDRIAWVRDAFQPPPF